MRAQIENAIYTLNATEVQRLIAAAEHPVDCNRLDKHSGLSLVHLASLLGSAEVLRVLLDVGRGSVFNGDDKGRLPLHCAVEGGSREAVEVLLPRFGSKIQTALKMEDQRGLTPLHLACDKPAVLKVLLATKPSLDQVGLLHRAVLGRQAGECVSLLLTEASEESVSKMLREVDSDGRSALVAACAEGRGDVALCLVEAKADVTLADTNAQTCAHWAFEMEHQALGERLVALEPELLKCLDASGRCPQQCIPQLREEVEGEEEEAAVEWASPLSAQAAPPLPVPSTPPQAFGKQTSETPLSQDREDLADLLAGDLEELELAARETLDWVDGRDRSDLEEAMERALDAEQEFTETVFSAGADVVGNEGSGAASLANTDKKVTTVSVGCGD